MAKHIFVIGPMRKTRDRIVVPSHTKVIKRAVAAILARHAPTDVVTGPDDLHRNTIATDVFAHLDAADLVIADLSQASPNVLYELAFVDALGVPTILVCDDDTDVPFYFLGQRVQKLRAITAKTVTKALEPLVLAVLRGEGDLRDFVSNPLHDFYQAPVVDISAAVGLAISYYENFVRHLIRNQGIFATSPERARGLLVVIPAALSNHQRDQQEIGGEVAKLTGLPAAPGEPLPRPGSDRPFTATLVGRLVVDVPSALYSLHKSPRMRQLRARLGALSAPARDARDATIARMTGSLITAFKSEVEKQIRDDTDTHRDRVVVRPAAELPAAVAEARAAGWLA